MPAQEAPPNLRTQNGTRLYAFQYLDRSGIQRMAKALGGSVIEGKVPTVLRGEGSQLVSRIEPISGNYLGGTRLEFLPLAEAFNPSIAFQEPHGRLRVGLARSVHYYVQKAGEDSGLVFVNARLDDEVPDLYDVTTYTFKKDKPFFGRPDRNDIVITKLDEANPLRDAILVASNFRNTSGETREAMARQLS